MEIKENQNRIYIRSVREWVPCTQMEFDEYYRDINAFRRKQMNHGRCVCPARKRLLCDMDCWNCLYHTSGDLYSLDVDRISDEGNHMNWLDYLQEKMPDLQTQSPEDIVIETQYTRKILNRLGEIMPQAIQIGKLREVGMSDTAIAEKIGVHRKTFAYRIKKASKILKNEFPDFF